MDPVELPLVQGPEDGDPAQVWAIRKMSII